MAGGPVGSPGKDRRELTDTSIFIFGAGYSGKALGLANDGFAGRIAGTTRSPGKFASLGAAGIEPLLFDGVLTDEIRAALDETTHLVVSVAPGEKGDPVLSAARTAIAEMPSLQWIGYLSTVGVYGDHGGAWVDEGAECRPVSQRSIMRLEAEREWQRLGKAIGKPVAVLRLSGIYGPGRSAVDRLRAGAARRISKPGQVFNRVHVDDIAAALEAAMAAPSAHEIYNVTDDEPAPADEVVAYAAGLLGIAPPPLVRFEDAPFTPIARSFYDQSKRVSNRRMKDSLGVKLSYPTYREGMAAIAAVHATHGAPQNS